MPLPNDTVSRLKRQIEHHVMRHAIVHDLTMAEAQNEFTGGDMASDPIWLSLNNRLDALVVVEKSQTQQTEGTQPMQKTIINDLVIDEVSFAKSPAMATDLIMKDDSFDDSDFDEHGMLKDTTFKPSNAPEVPEDQSEVARSTRVRSKLEDELDKMARNHMAENAGMDFYEAYEAVAKTPAGLELLQALQDATDVQHEVLSKARLADNADES